VLAIYVRNVSRDPTRHRAIEELAAEVVDAGSALLLAADSMAMAEHAAEHGLISRAACAQVLAELEDDPEQPATDRDGAGETRRARSEDELERALEAARGEEAPPNVVVEADQRRE
jgi:hypothetical protein